MKTLMSIVTLLSVVFALPFTAHAIEKPDIDLYNGTLNGRVFYTLTIDDITGLFGKTPHLYKRSLEGEVYETLLFYPDLGLEFQVDKKSCRVITIDISGKNLNNIGREVKKMNVKKYSGVLSKGIDGRWKPKRVMAEFKDNNPQVSQASSPDNSVRAKVVGVQFRNYVTAFYFDAAKEFLIAITLLRETNVK
jgi:hypothetical protein